MTNTEQMMDTVRRVARLAVAGKTMPQIAAKLGISQQRVRRIAINYRITIQPAMRTPLADWDAVKKMIEEQGVEATAAHYEVTRQAIYKRLSKERER